MAYNPSKHIPLSKPMGAVNFPVDARTYFFDEVNFKYRPYVSVSEVNSYLSPQFRNVGLFVVVNTGGTLSDGNITGGVNDVYLYKNGIGNSDLVLIADFSPIQNWVSRMDKNPIFYGDKTDPLVSSFVWDLNIFGFTIKDTDVLYIDNIRRGQSNRHLVRLSVNGNTVAVWYKDNHTEPTPDANGNRVETVDLKLLPEETVVVGQITVNWSVLSVGVGYIFTSEQDRLKTQLNPYVTKQYTHVSKYDLTPINNKIQNLSNAGNIPAVNVLRDTKTAEYEFDRLDKSDVFYGKKIDSFLPDMVIALSLQGVLASSTDIIHIYLIRKKLGAGGEYSISIGKNGIRIATWNVSTGYVEPSNGIAELTLAPVDGSGVTGTVIINWQALDDNQQRNYFSTTSAQQQAQISPKVYRYIAPKVNASQVSIGSTNVENKINQLDKNKYFQGTSITSKILNLVVRAEINGVVASDTDNVHVYWAWRQVENGGIIVNSFSVGLNGTRIASWTSTSGYVEPAEDAKGNRFEQLSLTPINPSTTTATILVNWSALSINERLGTNAVGDYYPQANGLFAPSVYRPRTTNTSTINASDVIKGSLNVSTWLDNIEKNNTFSGDQIPDQLRNFILDMQFVSPPAVNDTSYVYVDNVRRKRQYTNPTFIRSLVRLSIFNGTTSSTICTWFRDGYVEPVADSAGNIFDTIVLTPENNSGITVVARVNWAALPSNSDINYNTVADRPKGKLSKNTWAALSNSTSTVKIDLPDAVTPNTIYTVLNDVDNRNIVPTNGDYTQDTALVRNYSQLLFVDRFIINVPANRDINFDQTLSDRYPIYSPRKNDNDDPTDHPTPTKSTSTNIIINGGTFYNNKTVTITHKSTRESSTPNAKPVLLPVTDSTGVGLGNYTGAKEGYAKKWWSVIHEQFVKCQIDDMMSAGYTAAQINAGTVPQSYKDKYNFAVVGTGQNDPVNANEIYTLKYRGVEVPVTLRPEARGGWGYFCYINKPFNTGRSQGLWDALGLGNGTGTDYTATATQVKTLDRTAWNPNAMVDTPAMRSWVSSQGGPSSGTLADYKAWAQGRADNPSNPFYDNLSTRTVTDGSGDVWQVKFSVAKYLSRHRTMNDSGVRLSPGDPNIGTSVSDVNSYDVYRPTHIVFQSCQNDTNTPHFGAMAKAMADAVKAEFTNQSWGSVNIGLSIIDGAGTYFPARYPEVGSFSLMNTAMRAVHNDNLGRLKSVISNEDTSKIWILYNGHITPTAQSVIYRSGNSSMFDFTGDIRDSFRIPSRGNPGIPGHPNVLAHRAWGEQVYSWIKYTLTLP